MRSGHRGKILSVAWSQSGSRLASGAYDQGVRVFTLGSAQVSTAVLREASSNAALLSGHAADVDQVLFHPSMEHSLASAGADKTVRVWDVRAHSKPQHTIQTVGENINIAWSPDGNTIAVGSKDDVISFIDPRGGSNSTATGPNTSANASSKYVWHTFKRDFEVNEIRWDYTGKLFYLTTGHGTVQILDFPSFKLVHNIAGHTGNCYCIDFDPMGRRTSIGSHFCNKRYMAIGSNDSLVSLWDLDEFVCIRTLGQLDMPVRVMTFAHCGELIAMAGTEDKNIDIASVETGETLYSVPVSCAPETASWHPSKYVLAFCGEEPTQTGTGGRGAVQDINIGFYALS
ncbi:WD40-repeat-containing domain protein [Chytriomyces sp. MP71]|nr:WD40-repeat-containing domain protein [Chytriomyces sp. MP71]